MIEIQVKGQSPGFWYGFHFLLAGLGLILFESTVLRWVLPSAFAPDFPLILVIYLGMFFPVSVGITLTGLLGLLVSTSTAAPATMNIAIYLLIWGLVLFIRQNIEPAAPFHQFILVLLLAMLAEILSWSALFVLVDRPFASIYSSGSAAVPVFRFLSIVVTGLFGPLFFYFLDLAGKPGEQKAGELL